MNPQLLALIGLTSLCILDVSLSRMTAGARILWVVLLVFLPGIALAAWLLTRHTAWRELPELPEPTPAPSPADPAS